MMSLDGRRALRISGRVFLAILLSLALVVHSASALVENPPGTLVAEAGDGKIEYRIIDTDSNNVPDIEASGAGSGNGLYSNIAAIDSTGASVPGAIFVLMPGAANIVVDSPNGGAVDVTGSATLAFTGVEDLSGGAGSDAFVLLDSLTGSIGGGAGFDELIAGDTSNIFIVNGPDAGTLNGISFQNFENLSGGGQVDTFTINGALSGTAAGGAGDDQFILQTGGSAGLFEGGAGFDDIIGGNTNNAIVVSGTDAGTLNGNAFQNIENLTGGDQADTFGLSAALTGTVAGGAGDDLFTLLPGGSAGLIDGGADFDELAAEGVNNVFVVNAVDAGTANGNSFQNVEDLSGGSQVDSFTVSAALTGMLSGGAGDDVFNLNDGGSVASIAGGADVDEVSYAGITTGVTVDLSAFSDVEVLTGSAFDDAFTVIANISATVNCGAGFDSVTIFGSALNDLTISNCDEISYAFFDVEPSNWAAAFITTFAASGITAGCGNGNFCPGDPITRAQLAVFLERGINGSSYTPPPATGNVFLDVGAGDFAADFIEQLANDGITAGCGNDNFCPNATVTRDQMAVFLLRAKYGAGYSPPPASGIFGDVDLSYWAVHWIEQLAAEGITAGCGGGNFCPAADVFRDQMAVFLVRTFGL